MTQAQAQNPFEMIPEVASPTAEYLKLKSSPSGEMVSFVILSTPVLGWEYWDTSGKVHRSLTEWQSTPSDCATNEEGKVRHPYPVIAFNVLDLEDMKCKVASFGQVTILRALKAQGAAWGAALLDRTMCINITGKSTGRKVDYTLVAGPFRQVVPPDALQAAANTDIRKYLDSGSQAAPSPTVPAVAETLM